MVSPTTVAFIGCGNIGSALLTGMLDATRAADTPPEKDFKFIVSTKTKASANRLRETYTEDAARVKFLVDDNVRAMNEAQVVFLAFPHNRVVDVLQSDGVWEALENKTVVSLLAGRTIRDLNYHLNNSNACLPFIYRAVPDIAARVRKSITIVQLLQTFPKDEYEHEHELVSSILRLVGKIKYVNKHEFNRWEMLGRASTAMMSVALDGILDGCVAQGLKRKEALELVPQMLKGMVGLLKDGAHLAMLREDISCPGGCAIEGLLKLEGHGARSTFAKATVAGIKQAEAMDNKEDEWSEE
ncbi:pyrroline-5-carboxylate reductase [Aspergillus egyptiacus]|nr:pyrroline-5-carboxylate reductase [Aspergillus egyptiacus]